MDAEGEDDDEDLNEEYDSTTVTESSRTAVVPQQSSGSTPLNRINHTFAVILKLDRRHLLNPLLKLKFASLCDIDWVNGIPDFDSKKTVFSESYKVSKDLIWNLSLDRPDCFIPFEEEPKSHPESIDNMDDLKFMDDSESSTTTDSKENNIVISPTPSQELKKLESYNYKERATLDQSILDMDDEFHFHNTSHSSRQFDPGYYVFLLPILFPPTMAETVTSPLGSVSYNLSVKVQPFIGADLKPPQQALFSTSPILTNKFLNSPLVPVTSPSSPPPLSSLSPNTNKFLKTLKHVGGSNDRKKDDDNVKEYHFELPVIRLTPPDSITTINKSVYVNKIWNDSLNYEITFPKKYVSMSSIDDDITSSFDLKIKIMPLVKKIFMKRIKVNMIEKITYASRNLKYEYDYGKENAQEKGVKERIIPLFEVKTKEKANTKSVAMRTEVVKNCIEDNLLTSCYEDYKPSKRAKVDDLKDEDTFITNTVKITCPLTFYIKNDTMIKNLKSTVVNNSNNNDSDVESLTSIDSQKHLSASSSFISMLSKSTIQQQQQLSKKDDTNQQFKEKYGLYPDISGFGNINIKHRLQICFRISKFENPENLKPGDDPNKLHHYEVIVDTPVVLKSPFATDQTPPSYSEVLMTSSDSQFHIRPIYNEEDGDEYDEPPPPPFEFNIGSPINGYDIQSEFESNHHDLSDTRAQRQRLISLVSLDESLTTRRSSTSQTAGGYSNIDELLVVENKESNLSKLLLSQPPDYSTLDHSGRALSNNNNEPAADELDIGGDNFVNEDDIGNHDDYNRRRIELEKRKNEKLRKKIEDDLGDFSF